MNVYIGGLIIPIIFLKYVSDNVLFELKQRI